MTEKCYKPGTWNRRGILKAGIAAGLTGLATPHLFIPRALAARRKQLVVVGWGGAAADAQRKAYFDPFTKATGIEIVQQVGAEMEKVKAQVEAGDVTWDLMVDIGRFRTLQGAEQNLLDKIDYNVVTDTADLIPHGVEEYGVASNVGSEVISYSTRTMAAHHPTTWAEFWDVKGFPGHRAMRRQAYGILDIALVADGVPPDKLYPLDVDRAFANLDRIKPHIDVWTTSYEQPQRLITDGEIDMATAWNARVWAAAAKGAPIALEWNQGFLYYDMSSVPRGAPNAKAAMQLINFSLDAKRQAHFSTLYPYGPANRKAIDLIPPDMRAVEPTAPQNFNKQIMFNDKWWAPRLTELTERFLLWVAKS